MERLSDDDLRTAFPKNLIFIESNILYHDNFPPAKCSSLHQICFQVVRTDLKELMEMDLEGAPYAYTPFCSDRTEMDGFR